MNFSTDWERRGPPFNFLPELAPPDTHLLLHGSGRQSPQRPQGSLAVRVADDCGGWISYPKGIPNTLVQIGGAQTTDNPRECEDSSHGVLCNG